MAFLSPGPPVVATVSTTSVSTTSADAAFSAAIVVLFGY